MTGLVVLSAGVRRVCLIDAREYYGYGGALTDLAFEPDARVVRFGGVLTMEEAEARAADLLGTAAVDAVENARTRAKDALRKCRCRVGDAERDAAVDFVERERDGPFFFGCT